MSLEHVLHAGTAIEEVDSLRSADDEDGDSGYDELSLSTASLRSSVFDYEQENGRSYHAFRKGKYVMPNDELEQDRMDIHYHSLRLTLGERHFIAPLANPTSVLDAGTGTGIWAMDVADDHPGAQVIGVDLSPIQPTAVPPNLEFQIMDLDEPWDFHTSFDLIHTRLMNGFSVKDWASFYNQAFAWTKPGGWVENQEFGNNWECDDGTQPRDSAVRRWQELFNTGLENLGLSGRIDPETMKRQMEEAGFVNVTIQAFKMPIGPWSKSKRFKQAGLFNLVGMVEGLSGLSQKIFTHGLGWTIQEMEVLLMEVRSEWRNPRIHSYLPIYVLFGQRPLANGS